MVAVRMPPVATPDEEVVRLMHLLSHVTRVRILREFAEADLFADAGGVERPALTPKGLAGTLDEQLGNISYHVRALVTERVLVEVRTEPRRGAVAHFYRPAVDVGPLLAAFDALAAASS